MKREARKWKPTMGVWSFRVFSAGCLTRGCGERGRALETAGFSSNKSHSRRNSNSDNEDYGKKRQIPQRRARDEVPTP